jgi:hypothetical protein
MFTPGYYKTNYGGLRFRELVRSQGLSKAFKNYLITRFKGSGSGAWMPVLWADSECTREALSEEFRLATKPHQLDFERLGFTVCRFSKSTKNLNPLLRDSGGITYLDPTRCHVGQLLFLRRNIQPAGKEVNNIVISFTAAFEKGSLSCTNHKNVLDPPDENKVIRFAPCDVNFIYQQFQQQLQKQKGDPRHFPDIESLRRWIDTSQVKTFEERAQRRLFIPMTSQEVATAKAKLLSGSPETTFQPPRFKFGLGFWLALVVFLILLQFVHRHPHGKVTFLGANMMEYQGQQFKMRKAYATYEDYKDDPDNLDTNELDRIEQAVISAQIPTSFKTRREFIHALFELEFPGYGVGSIGESVQTDDGSTLDVESVEIPQRDKNRYIVAREFAGQLTVVDDFVSGSSTNAISHVKLEKQKLHYYDGHNNLVREKQL